MRYSDQQRQFHQKVTPDRNLPERLRPSSDHPSVIGEWSKPSVRTNGSSPKQPMPIKPQGVSVSVIPEEVISLEPIQVDPNRYASQDSVLHYRNEAGQGVVYYPRRILPPGGSRPMLTEHTVKDGERLDLIAYHYFGDPLLYWEIADANNAMKPEDLMRVGNRLLIPNLS